MKKNFSLNNQNGVSQADNVFSIKNQNGKSGGAEVYGIANMNGVTNNGTVSYHLLNQNSAL